MAHLAIAPSGEVIGFAISGTEQRGAKVFLYELHVHKDRRRRGIGSALMEMAWRTARGANRTRTMRRPSNTTRSSAALRGVAT